MAKETAGRVLVRVAGTDARLPNPGGGEHGGSSLPTAVAPISLKALGFGLLGAAMTMGVVETLHMAHLFPGMRSIWRRRGAALGAQLAKKPPVEQTAHEEAKQEDAEAEQEEEDEDQEEEEDRENLILARHADSDIEAQDGPTEEGANMHSLVAEIPPDSLLQPKGSIESPINVPMESTPVHVVKSNADLTHSMSIQPASKRSMEDKDVQTTEDPPVFPVIAARKKTLSVTAFSPSDALVSKSVQCTPKSTPAATETIGSKASEHAPADQSTLAPDELFSKADTKSSLAEKWEAIENELELRMKMIAKEPDLQENTELDAGHQMSPTAVTVGEESRSFRSSRCRRSTMNESNTSMMRDATAASVVFETPLDTTSKIAASTSQLGTSDYICSSMPTTTRSRPNTSFSKCCHLMPAGGGGHSTHASRQRNTRGSTLKSTSRQGRQQRMSHRKSSARAAASSGLVSKDELFSADSDESSGVSSTALTRLDATTAVPSGYSSSCRRILTTTGEVSTTEAACYARYADEEAARVRSREEDATAADALTPGLTARQSELPNWLPRSDKTGCDSVDSPTAGIPASTKGQELDVQKRYRCNECRAILRVQVSPVSKQATGPGFIRCCMAKCSGVAQEISEEDQSLSTVTQSAPVALGPEASFRSTLTPASASSSKRSRLSTMFGGSAAGVAPRMPTDDQAVAELLRKAKLDLLIPESFPAVESVSGKDAARYSKSAGVLQEPHKQASSVPVAHSAASAPVAAHVVGRESRNDVSWRSGKSHESSGVNYEDLWQQFQNPPKVTFNLDGARQKQEPPAFVSNNLKVGWKTPGNKDDEIGELAPIGPRGFATIVMSPNEVASAANLCVSLRNVCPDCGTIVVTVPGLDPAKMGLLKNSADILILIGASGAPFGDITTMSKAAPLLWKMTFFQKIVVIPPHYELSRETPTKVYGLLNVDRTSVFWEYPSGGMCSSGAMSAGIHRPRLCALVLIPSRKVYNKLKRNLKVMPASDFKTDFEMLKYMLVRSMPNVKIAGVDPQSVGIRKIGTVTTNRITWSQHLMIS